MTNEEAVATEKEAKKPKKMGIIDCDLHITPKNKEEIHSRLKQPFYDAYRFKGRGIFENPSPDVRPDARPPGGGPTGSDPDFVRKQHIDAYGINYAILHPWSFGNFYPDPRLNAAICTAYNEWLDETWLSKYNHDGVFKAGICIAHMDPESAVREIERWAGHPHFVEVMTDSGSRTQFGNPHYWPIFEACERHGLPFATHPGSDGVGVSAPMMAGFPRSFVEWLTTLSFGYGTHLVSMLTEGVFEKFPNLKVTFLEGGSAWVPSIMWRLDALWKSFRYEIPWVKRAPSSYLRDHVRFGSQPLERPDNDEFLINNLIAMDAEHIMVYASDYPHFDTDVPTHVFPRKMPENMRRRIFFDNASEWYNLK